MSKQATQKCKYTPLFARVIVRREVKEKSSGGIIIPDAKRHAKLNGVVVAKGPTADESIHIGDNVIFGAHAGKWLDASSNMKGEDADDGTLFICQDEDLLAIVGE